MRTIEETKEAIEKLKQNKDNTSEFTAFGDNKHDALDAMMDVIRNHYDENDVEEIWGEGYIYDAAMGAVDYLNGYSEIDEFLYPV